MQRLELKYVRGGAGTCGFCTLISIIMASAMPTAAPHCIAPVIRPLNYRVPGTSSSFPLHVFSLDSLLINVFLTFDSFGAAGSFFLIKILIAEAEGPFCGTCSLMWGSVEVLNEPLFICYKLIWHWCKWMGAEVDQAIRLEVNAQRPDSREEAQRFPICPKKVAVPSARHLNTLDTINA